MELQNKSTLQLFDSVVQSQIGLISRFNYSVEILEGDPKKLVDKKGNNYRSFTLGGGGGVASLRYTLPNTSKFFYDEGISF